MCFGNGPQWVPKGGNGSKERNGKKQIGVGKETMLLKDQTPIKCTCMFHYQYQYLDIKTHISWL
jgi:hypothetical protein